MSPFKITFFKWPEALDQRLRVFAALPEDQSSVPGTLGEWLTTLDS